MTGFYLYTVRHSLPARCKTNLKNPFCCSLVHMYAPSLSLIPGNGCQQRPRPGFNATAESIGLNLAIIAEWCVIFNGAGTKLNSKTPRLMVLKGVIFCYCRFNRLACREMEKTMLVILPEEKGQRLIWLNNNHPVGPRRSKDAANIFDQAHTSPLISVNHVSFIIPSAKHHNKHHHKSVNFPSSTRWQKEHSFLCMNNLVCFSKGAPHNASILSQPSWVW